VLGLKGLLTNNASRGGVLDLIMKNKGAGHLHFKILKVFKGNVQRCTKICGTTTIKYKKPGTNTKKYKTVSYIKQQSTKILDTMIKKYKSLLRVKMKILSANFDMVSDF
jgi:hypothetical protein